MPAVILAAGKKLLKVNYHYHHNLYLHPPSRHHHKSFIIFCSELINVKSVSKMMQLQRSGSLKMNLDG